MENARCNIELNNNRFVQAKEWKDQIRIDVREWELKDGKLIPTRKGISLSLNRWKLLTNSFDKLDQALAEQKDHSSHLGGNVYSSVQARANCVNIRQYWLPPNETEVVPTRKGITLRPGEYAKLKDVASVIGDFVPELNSIVPCPYSSDHQNQLGFLRCSECNPDNFLVW
ncbi:unnamed protein product [Mytilus edulis]|uniref:Transcriptional coactivator p15 (PC4) C-terminal domain-containing protein n=1 Tax=Mytilus edulis TaxID=6550 RepID=A0A8S3TUX6_MYTED|nr:unnamed protein product [Mytilus edulis]